VQLIDNKERLEQMPQSETGSASMGATLGSTMRIKAAEQPP